VKGKDIARHDCSFTGQCNCGKEAVRYVYVYADEMTKENGQDTPDTPNSQQDGTFGEKGEDGGEDDFEKKSKEVMGGIEN